MAKDQIKKERVVFDEKYIPNNVQSGSGSSTYSHQKTLNYIKTVKN